MTPSPAEQPQRNWFPTRCPRAGEHRDTWPALLFIEPHRLIRWWCRGRLTSGHQISQIHLEGIGDLRQCDQGGVVQAVLGREDHIHRHRRRPCEYRLGHPACLADVHDRSTNPVQKHLFVRLNFGMGTSALPGSVSGLAGLSFMSTTYWVLGPEGIRAQTPVEGDREHI